METQRQGDNLSHQNLAILKLNATKDLYLRYGEKILYLSHILYLASASTRLTGGGVATRHLLHRSVISYNLNKFRHQNLQFYADKLQIRIVCIQIGKMKNNMKFKIVCLLKLLTNN